MTTQETEALDKLMDDCADRLSEYCDSVRIFITTPNTGDGTPSSSTGRGNLFTQMGQVRSWLIRQEERERVDARHEEDEFEN